MQGWVYCLTRRHARAGNKQNHDKISTARHQSVRDRPLLARIDVSPFACLEEKRRHVTCQKSPRLRVHHVQTIMVDQHGLLLAPVCPTLSADLGYNASTDLTRERRLFESFPFLTTARTCYDRHDDLLPCILDLRQPEE